MVRAPQAVTARGLVRRAGLAILEPEVRNRTLEIEAHQGAAFQHILAESSHRQGL